MKGDSMGEKVNCDYFYGRQSEEYGYYYIRAY